MAASVSVVTISPNCPTPAGPKARATARLKPKLSPAPAILIAKAAMVCGICGLAASQARARVVGGKAVTARLAPDAGRIPQ